MPSPSAIAVWVSDRSMRRRRMRGPAKIFCSAIVSALPDGMPARLAKTYETEHVICLPNIDP